MQAARRIAEHDVHISRLCRGERVEQHRAGIGTLAAAHDLHARAVCPNFELVRRRRAEGIRRAQQHALALLFVAVGELADARGLAHAVHADDEHDARRCGEVEARIADLELLFQNVAQRLLDVVAALNALFVYHLTQLLHGVRRDRRAEVCHDQALLQLVVEILVDGLPDDAVVPRLFDPCKNTHRLTP